MVLIPVDPSPGPSTRVPRGRRRQIDHVNPSLVHCVLNPVAYLPLAQDPTLEPLPLTLEPVSEAPCQGVHLSTSSSTPVTADVERTDPSESMCRMRKTFHNGTIGKGERRRQVVMKS